MNTEDLQALALRNAKFREVVWTTQHMQLVLMYLEPGQEIGKEIHPETTQFIAVAGGTGRATLGARKLVLLREHSALMVPAGTEHNVWAAEKGEGLWLYTLYSPPHH